MDALLLHRIHFGFTITYHYLFPQLTMGLALLIVALKSIALWHKNERYNEAATYYFRVLRVPTVRGRTFAGRSVRLTRRFRRYSSPQLTMTTLWPRPCWPVLPGSW